VEQIAAERGINVGTVYGHLADAVAAGKAIRIELFLDLATQKEIAAAFQKLGSISLSPVFDALQGRYDYGRLKLMRAAMARQRV